MKSFRTNLSLALALALSLSAPSFAEDNTPRTAGQTLDDATITATVKAQLLADDRTEGFDINVDTMHGVVTLRGGADTEADKIAASSIAAAVSGVKRVHNDLTVAAEGTATRTAANTATASGEIRAEAKEVAADVAEATSNAADSLAAATDKAAEEIDEEAEEIAEDTGDAWLTTKVKTQLLAAPDIEGTAIEVETKDGIVHLTGTLPTKLMKTRAIDVASSTDGVIKVDSDKLIAVR